MENLVWRSRAKVVAIVDMVMLSISLFSAIAVVLLVATTAMEDRWNLSRLHPQGPFGMILIVVPTVLVCFGAQMFAAMKLREATNPECQSSAALTKVRIWQIIVVIFLVITVLGCIVSLNISTLVITVLWRGIGIAVVLQYVKEMEAV